MQDERITLWAPEWPSSGDGLVPVEIKRLEYVNAHASGVGPWLVAPAAMVASRMQAFDAAMMRGREA